MEENKTLNNKKAKRLPKGERTRIRRMKQALRKDPTVVVKPQN